MFGMQSIKRIGQVVVRIGAEAMSTLVGTNSLTSTANCELLKLRSLTVEKLKSYSGQLPHLPFKRWMEILESVNGRYEQADYKLETLVCHCAISGANVI